MDTRLQSTIYKQSFIDNSSDLVQQHESLKIEEATSLVNEQAFEKLDSQVISFCLAQIIRHLRLKTMSK